MKNDKCEAVLCGKPVGDKPITVIMEGKAHRYHDIGCALEAILVSLKAIEFEIQSLQEQLKK